jgi:hypothetical protein
VTLKDHLLERNRALDAAGKKQRPLFRSVSMAVPRPDDVTITAVKGINNYELELEIDGVPVAVTGVLMKRICKTALHFGYTELEQLVGTRLVPERHRTEAWWNYCPDPLSYK